MAIDRDLLKEYLAVNHPGPGVRQRLDSILAFVLDQDEGSQQTAIDAWKGEFKTKLEAQKAETDTQSDALRIKIDALG